MMPQEELSDVVAQSVVFSGCLKQLEGKKIPLLYQMQLFQGEE